MLSRSVSPYQRHQDIEAAGGYSSEEGQESFDKFNIRRTKDAPPEQLMQWRKAVIKLNATRRFRYTLDLKKEEEKRVIIQKILADANAIKAAIFFQAGLEPGSENGGDFAITQQYLANLPRDKLPALQLIGGVEGLSKHLKTSLENGIPGDVDDLLHRKTAFGSNTYPPKQGRTFWMFFREAWRDFSMILLSVLAVATLLVDIPLKGLKRKLYEGGSLAFALLIVVIARATSDYRQYHELQLLTKEKRKIRLEVIRGGRRIEVSIDDIVVGDVVPLNIGDQVPADGVLISHHLLAVDESSMTGENDILYKDFTEPFLTSGCKIYDGSGTMLVTNVGMHTKWGLLMASTLEDTGEETPMQIRLNGIANFIARLGICITLCIATALLIWYYTGNSKNPDGSPKFNVHGSKFGLSGKESIFELLKGICKILKHSVDYCEGAIKIGIIAGSILSLAVPDGLPLAITTALAFSVRKMIEDKALLRRLSACETMGCASTICIGKTGILTQNEMTVVVAYIGGEKEVDNTPRLSPILSSLLIEGIAQNTMGSVFTAQTSGSQIEKAILEWGLRLQMQFDEVRSNAQIVHISPFNSERKRSGVALRLMDGSFHIHWKGAAEIVLASCRYYKNATDRVVPLTNNKIRYFENSIEDMATAGLLCVAFAYTPYPMENFPTSTAELYQWELPEDNLILLAIAGIKDPCRPDVKEAVKSCRSAGVTVFLYYMGFCYMLWETLFSKLKL